MIATAPQKHLTLDDLKLSPNPLLVVAEAIEKPGNLGSILRSADAVGADAVIVCDRTTDIHNPNVVRASTGVVFLAAGRRSIQRRNIQLAENRTTSEHWPPLPIPTSTIQTSI